MGLIVSALVWGFGIAYAILGWFGAPNWLRYTIVAGVLVWILWYNVTAHRHNKRNISGAQLRDDQAHAQKKKPLTLKERFENRFRGAHHVPRKEIDQLYGGDHA